MKQTYSQKQESEIQVFGCTLEVLKESVEDTIAFAMGNVVLIAMSNMSNAQEEMSLGFTNNARHMINCAKWILSTYVLENKRV